MRDEKYAKELIERQLVEVANPLPDHAQETFIHWLDTVLGDKPVKITYIVTDEYDVRFGELKTILCKPRSIEDKGIPVRFDPDEILPCLAIKALDGSSAVLICIYDIVQLEVVM